MAIKINLDDLTPEQIRRLVKRWVKSPLAFAVEAFGFNPSNQQKDFLEELRRLVDAKIKVDLGKELTEEEEKYAKKRGISVMSGKGTGKDGIIAIAIYWFLFCFRDSNTYAVAPNLQTIKTNLIAEMSKWKDRRVNREYVCIIRDKLELTSKGCKIKSDPEKGKNWFLTTMSAGNQMPADKQLETLQGKHARFQMFVIDEASGVPDPVFKPLDETLTDPINFVLLIFNPTRRTGFAIRTQQDTKESKYWIRLQWNAEESSLVTPSQIEYLRDKYGISSNEYRVSVLGLPPLADDSSLIPYEWCIDATQLEFYNENDAYLFGVDVAREGKDKSIVLVKRGNVVEKIYELKENNLFELAVYVAGLAADYEPAGIYIDTVGLGIGVYEKLRELGIPHVFSVNVGRGAKNSRKFKRLRDELWWKLRCRMQDGLLSLLPVANDRELIAELSSIKFAVLDDGKIKVESKADMKSRGLPSPNKGDSLMMLEMAVGRHKKVNPSEDDYFESKNNRSSFLSWMEV